jgi:hypothetical protein
MSEMHTRPCARCGASLSANQRFCTNCGAIVDNVPGVSLDSAPGGRNFSPTPPPLSIGNAQVQLAPQWQANQQVPSVPGTPSLPPQIPPHWAPGQAGQPVHPASFHGLPAHGQPSLPPQAPLAAGPQAQPASFAGQPASFHAPSAPPPHVQPPLVPGQHALPATPSLHAAGSVATRTAHMGMRVLLTKPVVAAIAVIVLAGSGAGIAFSLYHASAPTSFVIATDRGNNQIDRIDLSTRSVTVLLSNKVLPGTPDSIVFMSDTKMLIDFLNNGEIGIGDIQQGTYQSLGAGHGGALRDMALRPDGSGVLISDANGNILEYHVDSQNFTTFVQNLGGVQGLAFDSNGALYAAVGGQVIQLDPTSGKQLKTFNLPGGSDGLAYDGHHHTLDIAVGSSIVALDPQTGKTAILTDGITTPDGLAIDRQGNLFIADVIGVLELNTNNQLLIVGTNTAGITWDDVAPLSGAGAASY